jgi:hypothetical protein
VQGFIHLLLEAYVSESIGPQQLRAIRRTAGIPGPPLAEQYYPDEMTTQLLQAICQHQNISLDDLLYQFGVYFMSAPLMHQHYRVFLEGHASARRFLEHVPTVHRHMARSFQQARLPDLRYIDHSPKLLEIVYASPRHLCPFLQGVLEGVGHYFHETLEVREMECQRRGAAACRFLVSFVSTRPSGPMADISAPGAARASGPQHLAEAQPEHSPEAAALEAKRQLEEYEDMLILHALASSETSPAHPLKPEAAPEPVYMPLSLFEIASWLTMQGVAAEYARLSLLQRSLTRLAVQGLVESRVESQHARQNTSSSSAAGHGVLAARRYRVTSAGLAWLREMQHRQEY